MKQFLYAYADLCALIGTLLIPLLFTIGAKQATDKAVRALPAYFFFFGPVGTMVFISFHLIENSYNAAVAALEGNFVYDFHFYSLILLGLVVFCIGLRLLFVCRQYAVNGGSYRAYFQTVLLLLLVSVPLIPIASIASVPGMVSLISMLAFPFLRRRQSAMQHSETLRVSSMALQ